MEKRTIIKMLREAARKFKDVPYLLDKHDYEYVPKTFSEVYHNAISFASQLLDMGIKKDDKIAILSEGRSAWVTSEFGLIMAGAVSVPLSTMLLPEEVLFRVNHSEAKAIIVSHNTFEKIASVWKKVEMKNFKIIYLDKSIEDFSDKARKFGINSEKDIFLFDKLIEKGDANFENAEDVVGDSIRSLQEDDTVSICYTSGTTGNPKGIMLTHLNYFSNSTDAMEFFDVKMHDRMLVILPIDHSFAHTICLYSSLLRGLSIYFVDARGGGRSALKNIPVNLKEANPHFMLTVPALTGNFMNKIEESINAKGGFIKKLFDKGIEAAKIINQDGYRKAPLAVRLLKMPVYKLVDKMIFSKIRETFGDSLRYCVGGGALLDIRQQKFFKAIGIPVYQGYGLTEASPVISANTPNMHKFGSSGKVLPSVNCRIIKSDGSPAAKGEKGEIVVQGENVMKGYFKNENATKETIKGSWLYTGDVGLFDEDGFLNVVGREKALLIAPDGEKYSPEGIEEAIANSSDLIHQVMVYNDHRKFTSALLTLDIPKVEAFIKKNKIADPEIFLKELKKSFYKFKYQPEYANHFPEKWIPSAFLIIEEKFSEANKMTNSTMKMVRHRIVEVYQSKIDEIYAMSGDKIVNAPNMEVIQKLLPFG